MSTVSHWILDMTVTGLRRARQQLLSFHRRLSALTTTTSLRSLPPYKSCQLSFLGPGLDHQCVRQQQPKSPAVNHCHRSRSTPPPCPRSSNPLNNIKLPCYNSRYNQHDNSNNNNSMIRHACMIFHQLSKSTTHHSPDQSPTISPCSTPPHPQPCQYNVNTNTFFAPLCSLSPCQYNVNTAIIYIINQSTTCK